MKSRSSPTIYRKHIVVVRLVLFLFASCLVGYGGLYFVQRHRALSPASVPISNSVLTSSVVQSTEAPIDTRKVTYNVAPDIPRLISMPTLGAEGFIQQVSTDAATNEMATPASIHMAGWYTKSVKPGDDGISIINGHVSGRYAPGIFKDLGKLRAGDMFSVEYGDGSRRQFKVEQVREYSLAQAAQHLFAHDPSLSQQLNLITCSGSFDAKSQRYQQRTIVVASRVQ